MKERITIKYKKRRISLTAEDCSFFRKFSGLMFSEKEKAGVLLFSFRRRQSIKIHSLFVFYDFAAVWLDDKNNVVDVKIVHPFSLCASPKKPCFKLLEIPLSRKNRKTADFFLKK